MENLPRFEELEDKGLQARNRGAILANLFESGSDETSVVFNTKSYLEGCGVLETKAAVAEMKVHLESRGFYFGN